MAIRNMRSLTPKRTYVILSLCYLAFVIYGSLIPFQFRSLPIAEAIDRFYRIPYLHLGIQSRADFVANILLYIPLSFFLTGALCKKTYSLTIKYKATLLVLLLCSFIAGAIEFIQVFFPPRTVSLNDVIAEILGTIIGISFWYTIGGRLTRLWNAISTGGREGLYAALVMYALFYLALCLFPFDFILSRSELSWKLSTNSYHAFVAKETCQSLIRCAVTFIVEIIAMVPFGILTGLRSRGRQNHILFAALVYGGVLGIVIETSQFFIASGISQGASVLTRIMGLGLGLWLFQSILKNWFSTLRPLLRTGIIIAALPYFLLVITLKGWFSHDWVGLEEALSKIDKNMFIPFYYHYFGTEMNAVVNLLSNAAAFVPIGVGYWAWHFSRRTFSCSALIASFYGVVAAVFIETGRLFPAGKYPDFTNVLIAGVSAGAGYIISEWVTRSFSEIQIMSTDSTLAEL